MELNNDIEKYPAQDNKPPTPAFSDDLILETPQEKRDSSKPALYHKIVFVAGATLAFLSACNNSPINIQPPIEQEKILQTDKTPTSNIAIPTEDTITPTVEIQNTNTSTIPTLIPTTPTLTPTETLKPTPTLTPTAEFKQEIPKEVAEALVKEMLADDSAKLEKIERNINKIFTVDPSQIYLTQLYNIGEHDPEEAMKKLSLSEDTDLNLIVSYKRIIKNSEGNTLTVGVIKEAGIDDSHDSCNKMSVVLSIEQADGLKYDFAKESPKEGVLSILPILITDIDLHNEREALLFLFKTLSFQSYLTGEKVNFSDMIDYANPAYNSVLSTYGGEWHRAAQIADHFSRELIEAGIVENIEKSYGDERRYGILQEDIPPRVTVFEGSSMKRVGGEQIGDVTMVFKDDVRMYTDIYWDYRSGSLMAVTYVLKDTKETNIMPEETETYTMRTIKSIEREEISLALRNIFGKPSNKFN